MSESPPVLLGFASLESGKDTEGRGWLHSLWDSRALLKFLGLEKDIALGHGLQELTLHPASCVPGPWLVLLSWGHKKALKPLIPGLTMASQVKGVLLFSSLVCVMEVIMEVRGWLCGVQGSIGHGCQACIMVASTFIC